MSGADSTDEDEHVEKKKRVKEKRPYVGTSEDFASSEHYYYYSGETPDTEEREQIQKDRTKPVKGKTKNPDDSDTMFDPIPWGREEESQEVDLYQPKKNEIVIIFKRSRITVEQIVDKILEETGHELELEKLYQHRRKGLMVARFDTPDLHTRGGCDYAIEALMKKTKGVMDCRCGEIENKNNPDSSEEEDSDDETDEDEDSEKENDLDPERCLSESDEFEADPKRIQSLISKDRDKDGFIYGKDEKSPLWSGRFPNKRGERTYDMTYIRTQADPDTNYRRESPEMSPHYDYIGFDSVPSEVKWQRVPGAEDGWLISACGDNNMFVLLNKRASLVSSVKYHNSQVHTVRANYAGTRFISAGSDHRLFFYNEKMKGLTILRDTKEIKALTFDRMSERVFYGGKTGRLISWDIIKEGPYPDSQKSWLFPHSIDFILPIKTNNSLIAVGGKGCRYASIIDVDNWKLVRQIRIPRPLADLRLSADETQLVLCYGNTLETWDYVSPLIRIDRDYSFNRGFFLGTKKTFPSKIALGAVDERLNRYAVVLQRDPKVVRGGSLLNDKEDRTFLGHTKPITTMDMGPDGYLVTGAKDKAVKLWPWPTAETVLRVFQEFDTAPARYADVADFEIDMISSLQNVLATDAATNEDVSTRMPKVVAEGGQKDQHIWYDMQASQAHEKGSLDQMFSAMPKNFWAKMAQPIKAMGDDAAEDEEEDFRVDIERLADTVGAMDLGIEDMVKRSAEGVWASSDKQRQLYKRKYLAAKKKAEHYLLCAEAKKNGEDPPSEVEDFVAALSSDLDEDNPLVRDSDMSEVDRPRDKHPGFDSEEREEYKIRQEERAEEKLKQKIADLEEEGIEYRPTQLGKEEDSRLREKFERMAEKAERERVMQKLEYDNPEKETENDIATFKKYAFESGVAALDSGEERTEPEREFTAH